VKKEIGEDFDITDLGAARQFLRIEIIRATSGVFLTQKEHCRDLLAKYFGENAVAARPTPMVPGTILHKDASL
jgi:hypothetical protein